MYSVILKMTGRRTVRLNKREREGERERERQRETETERDRDINRFMT